MALKWFSFLYNSYQKLSATNELIDLSYSAKNRLPKNSYKAARRWLYKTQRCSSDVGSGIQPEDLNIKHVREPGDWVPVAGVGDGKRFFKTLSPKNPFFLFSTAIQTGEPGGQLTSGAQW